MYTHRAIPTVPTIRSCFVSYGYTRSHEIYNHTHAVILLYYLVFVNQLLYKILSIVPALAGSGSYLNLTHIILPLKLYASTPEKFV